MAVWGSRASGLEFQFCSNGILVTLIPERSTLLRGPWGLSRWVHDGDNWGYYTAYMGY